MASKQTKSKTETAAAEVTEPTQRVMLFSASNLEANINAWLDGTAGAVIESIVYVYTADVSHTVLVLYHIA